MSSALKRNIPLKVLIKDIFKPEELIRYVRQHSVFYRELYRHLPKDASLADLPVTPQDEFWKANSVNTESNKVLTSYPENGLILRSGGTTGNPKFSAYSKREWELFLKTFAECFAQGPIQPGDRVVNLFHAGAMYGSFIFTHSFLSICPVETVQLPVAGHTEMEEIAQCVSLYKGNVLAGAPTGLLLFAEYVSNHPNCVDRNLIERMFYAGEPMFQDQIDRFKEIFPNVQIYSIGYASTDAGVLGYADISCKLGEHRCLDGHTITEIIDEKTNEIIEEVGREGIIVVTNLTRTLMPIIRYPAGDLGMWVEPVGSPYRKFQLLGRSEESARISSIKFYVHDMKSFLDTYSKKHGIVNFQMVLVHRNKLDGLVLKIATKDDPKKQAVASAEMIKKMEVTWPLYKQFLDAQRISPIEIQWVTTNELERNKRTGKTPKVFDKRLLK